MKNACFVFQGQFLILFSFPSNILWLFIIFLTWTSQTHHVTLEKSPLLPIISTSIFKKKVWIFLFFISISCSLPWTSWFMSYYCDLKFIDEYGRFWVFAVLLKLLCGCVGYTSFYSVFSYTNVVLLAHTHSIT